MKRNTRKPPYNKRRAVRYNSKPRTRVEAPYPHFRYYKKSGHPALIVGERNQGRKEEYKYRKVMHGGKDGRHLNETVCPNPDPDDPEPMNIAKRVRHDLKNNFEERPLPWKYSPKE